MFPTRVPAGFLLAHHQGQAGRWHSARRYFAQLHWREAAGTVIARRDPAVTAPGGVSRASRTPGKAYRMEIVGRRVRRFDTAPTSSPSVLGQLAMAPAPAHE